MIKPRNAYFIHMTPGLAGKWIAEYRYKKQRAVRQWRVDQHATEMIEGNWIPGYPMQLCRLNGDLICTDGQHRQLAVIKSGEPQMFAVVELACDTEEDVEKVYYKTDRNITRTVADMYRSTEMASELGLNDTQLSALGAACTVIGSNFVNVRQGNAKINDAQRLSLIRQYGESAGVYFETIEGTQNFMRPTLKRAPVLAVAVAAFRYAPRVFPAERIVDFWRGVAIGESLASDDPRSVARNHLLLTNLGNGTSRGKNVTADYQARYIAQCYNKWILGQTGGTKVCNEKAPIVIEGTPWTGKSA